MSSMGRARAGERDRASRDRASMPLLAALIDLEGDAIEVHRIAIERLENDAAKIILRAALVEHIRHVDELREFVFIDVDVDREDDDGSRAQSHRSHGQPDPSHLKSVLPRGKAALEALSGDIAILQAMKANEDETNAVYQRVCGRSDLPQEIRDLLFRHLAEERRHRNALERRLRAAAQLAASE